MIKLPASVEKKLKECFPRAPERNRFVVDIIEKALETQKGTDENPHFIGGTLHLFTDGGARGNPGRAAIGCVLMDPQSGAVLQEYAEAIGTTTNNIAEYEALIAGLKIAKDFRPNHLVCHLDSELVVKQLKGEYRVKMQTFVPLIEQINALVKEFPTVSFVAIPRERNRHADRLLNAALDGLE
ncbi:MAG: ribonuclease HI family protein [Candidatus Peribacteraceae bacterium]